MSQIAVSFLGVNVYLNPNLEETSKMVCLNTSLFSNLENSESGPTCLSLLSLYALHVSLGYGKVET